MDAEKFASSFDIRLTPQRRIILDVLLNSRDHPYIEDIHKRALKFDQNIGLATIYRNVSLLESIGAIQKLDIGDGKARYEISSTNTDHHHLIDISTGDIIEFSFCQEQINDLTMKIGQYLGYEIHNYKFELYGIAKNKKDQ